MNNDSNWGADLNDVCLLRYCLGLTEDILPVVSNPSAVISPRSTIKHLGKTPSKYNNYGEVVGIKGWSAYKATHKEVDDWIENPDYGICLITRHIRAFDIDVECPDKADIIVNFIFNNIGHLPKRYRDNSGKCLLAFRLEGDFPKRILPVQGGMLEFLGNGQQFIYSGTHTSGKKYQWDWQNLNDFPKITAEQFEKLYEQIRLNFAVGSDTISKTRKKSPTLKIFDPLLEKLDVLAWSSDGLAYIECPFKYEHTTPSNISSTVYLPMGTNGHKQGHFKCMHAHCAHRSDEEFRAELGIEDDCTNDFEVIPDNENKTRFNIISAEEFVNTPLPRWLIKKILPEKGLAMIYGESNSGKTFLTLDIAFAIARGLTWRNFKTRQGKVIYIAAEGSDGIKKRVRASSIYNNIPLNSFRSFYFINDAPNLFRNDTSLLIERILTHGGVNVIIIDTLAQVSAGADENSSQMNSIISNCQKIQKATDSLVILVHHTGKEASKGPRGWSGLMGALDTAIEVTNGKTGKSALVKKQKDGENNISLPFSIQPIVIGTDEDGEEITSCIVEHNLNLPHHNIFNEHQVMGSNQKVLLDTFSMLTHVKVEITKSEIIEAAIQNLPKPAGKRDSRKDGLERSLDNLVEKGIFTESEGILSLSHIRN